MKKMLSAALLTVAALPASAEGFYAGFGVANVEANEAGESWSSTNAGVTLGYEVNEYIAVEGEASFVLSEGSLMGVDVGNKHMGAFVKFALPTSGPFTPHARLGYVKGEATASGNGVSISVDETAVSYGVGASYDFGSTALRVDYTVADFGETDTKVLAIGTVWKF